MPLVDVPRDSQLANDELGIPDLDIVTAVLPNLEDQGGHAIRAEQRVAAQQLSSLADDIENRRADGFAM